MPILCVIGSKVGSRRTGGGGGVGFKVCVGILQPRTPVLCVIVSHCSCTHSLPGLIAHAGPAHGVDFVPPWHHSFCPPHSRPHCSCWARSWCGLRTRRRSTSTSCAITPPVQIRWAGIDGSGLGCVEEGIPQTAVHYCVKMVQAAPKEASI